MSKKIEVESTKTINILVPILSKEMKEIESLSKSIINLIINSTVKSVLEQTNQDPNNVDTVIVKWLIREDYE